jgi:hypothetical protein
VPRFWKRWPVSRPSHRALVRRAWLWAGVVLFCVTTHLANHALGLLSLQTMEAGRN